MIHIEALIYPLAMTIAAECLVAGIIGIKKPRQFVTIVAMNLITNPLLNIVIRVIIGRTGSGSEMLPGVIALSEAVVVFTEAVLLSLFAGKLPMKPLYVSMILNLSSFASGILAGIMIDHWA